MVGYKEDFVSAVDEDVKCFICHFPLREPVQTRCGHRFCRECLEESTRSLITYDWGDWPDDDGWQSFTCPVDNVKLDHAKDVFPDKATERKILALIIKCPDNDCEWTGALNEIDTHLESCLFLTIFCTNKNCEETMKRKDLDEHVTVECQWRMVHCSHCSEPYPKCQEKEHIGECKKYLVECPAACGVEIPREKIPDHTGSDCPLITIPCPYAQMGCDVKIPRNQIESHLQSSSRVHLDMACLKLHNTQEGFTETTRKLEEKVNSLCRQHDERISGLEQQLKEFKKVNDFLVVKVAAQGKEITRLHVKPPRLSWKIGGIGQLLGAANGKKTVIHSVPFYSATNGYKLKVSVYPNGDNTKKHTYFSIFLVIMEGEYDAVLSWPFHQKVSFTLIDQQEESKEKKNITMEFTSDPSLASCAKPTKVEKPGIGFTRFISHKNIKTRRYILNDSLLLHVDIHPPH